MYRTAPVMIKSKLVFPMMTGVLSITRYVNQASVRGALTQHGEHCRGRHPVHVGAGGARVQPLVAGVHAGYQQHAAVVHLVPGRGGELRLYYVLLDTR